LLRDETRGARHIACLLITDRSHANSLAGPTSLEKLLAASWPYNWDYGSGESFPNGLPQIERDDNASEDIKPDATSPFEPNDSRPSNPTSSRQITLAQAKRLPLRLAGSCECSH
jgi:hypothetical protein